mgnify:FL=1
MTLFAFNDRDQSVINLRCVVVASKWLHPSFMSNDVRSYILDAHLIGCAEKVLLGYESEETRDAAYARVVDKLGELWV